MKSVSVVAVAFILVSLSVNNSSAAPKALVEMGCFNCHVNQIAANPFHERLPDLSQAGSRYTPDHLWRYLRKPRGLRKNLGLGRMPSFPLSDVEWVHLIEYLRGQSSQKLPDGLVAKIGGSEAVAPDKAAVGKVLFEKEYGCVACHEWEGKGGKIGPELTTAGERLRVDWLRRYLADPKPYAPKAQMPGLFYTRTSNGDYVSARPKRDVKADLDAVVSFLVHGRKSVSGDYARVKKQTKGVDAKKGEAIFRAMNCVACHRNTAQADGVSKNGPSLNRIGKGVLPSYLAGYLEKPVPIRPFGTRPGDGGRMPSFRLSKQEVSRISKEVQDLGAKTRLRKSPKPRALSAFQKKKAESLVRNKLSCLGCHRLNGEGGRVAPRLDGVASRLTPNYIYNVLNHPRETVEGGAMPKIRFRPTPKVGRLIYDWLAGLKEGTPNTDGYLSALDHPTIEAAVTAKKGERLYVHNCAHCHGPRGDGDGFNARYMNPPPAKHSSKQRMAKRPDDTLFDGIHVGAFVLNQNHRMPGFGASLSRDDIWSLVKYIRSLCQCTQPDWAGDGLKQ